MKKNPLITLFIIAFCSLLQAQDHAVPYTLEDRDRLIRLEIELKALRTEMNTKFESIQIQFGSIQTQMDTRFGSIQTQINDLKNLFYWGFGILITLFMFLFGYIIYDRSTAKSPVREKTYSKDEKMKAIEKVLKEFGKEQPKFAKILKSYGL